MAVIVKPCPGQMIQVVRSQRRSWVMYRFHREKCLHGYDPTSNNRDYRSE